MINWIKPNGNEITTNDEKATVEYCKSLGWKLTVEEDKPKKPKPTKKG